MSIPNFAERFKNKSSTLSLSGMLAVNPDRAVSKAVDSQLHSTIIKSSAEFLLKKVVFPQAGSVSEFNSSNPSIKLPQNEHPHVQSSFLPMSSDSPKLVKRKLIPITPILSKNPEKLKESVKGLNKSYDRKETRDFTPYTLKDYYSIKPKTYYQLGGLGPSNVGTEDWLQKKNLKEKSLKYGLNVYYINAAKLPLIPVYPNKSLEKEENYREKALKFSRNIQKPPLKKNLISLLPNRD